MRLTRHRRLFFAVLSGGLLLLSTTAPERAQSPTPQSPAASPRPSKPDIRKAKRAFALGLEAEQSQDWLAAFAAYEEALRYAPGNSDALLHRELARSQMMQQHTDRAEREALAGRMDQARAELREALRLDPTYSLARERLTQFEQDAPQAPPAEPSLGGLIRLRPQPGLRDLSVRGDTRSAYEAIAQEFGLIASLDADLPTRPVRFRVAGVDFETAMKLLAGQTGTFWRPLDSHTFFVAANTPEKRREFAPVVMRTVVLPAATAPDRMTEILRLVREIAGVTHIELDTRSRTITLRDSPENIALAAALVAELEQAPGEIMLEIEILEVDRDVARRLGVTPPSSAKLFTINPADVRAAQQAKSIAELLAIVQRVFGTAIPPLVAFGGGRTVFLATLPGAVADFSETLSLIRSGRRVLLRTQDGRPATFFVGERFPIALALLGASVGVPQLVAGATPIVFPRADFPTGNAPVALAAGDFNADGKLDLAVVNHGSNSVSILLGNGDGTFQAHVDFPAGPQPTSVAVGDFNGDGKLDLAVTNQGSVATIASGNGAVRAANVVTITTTSPHGLSTSQRVAISGVSDSSFDGTFTIATVPSTTTFTYAQTASDATSGGGTVSTGAVSLLLGNGDGTFQTQTILATGTSPSAVIARDFNGDGKLDLAVTNQADNTVSILLGNGDGTFTTHVDFPVGTKPASITAGDFNGDAKLDLAVANQGFNNVSVLLGKGDGTFTTHVDYPVNSSPSAVVTADFNADNKLDLAVANAGSNNVSILLGIGDGTFNPKTDFQTGNGPASLAVGDFNLDGKLDLAVANQGSDTISVLLGSGDGSFGTRLEITTGAGPTGIIAPDVRADGRPDIVTADQNANAVSVILNPAASIASSVAIPQTAYPGAEYEDLGLKVRATPRIHTDDEVTLQLEFEIRALSGTSINGIPVISNRTISQTVRLRENETTVLSGIVQREETRTITGLPGLAHAPVVGHLAGRRNIERHDTELLILLTPRQLRLAPRADRSIYAGRGEPATATGGERPPTPH